MPEETIYSKQRRAHEAYLRQLDRVRQLRQLKRVPRESMQRELDLLKQDQHTAQEADETIRLIESGELDPE